jgi:hypothetical protein
VAQQFDSEKLPQTLVTEIRPFLRAANQVEAENPRVAYLCECPIPSPARVRSRPARLLPVHFSFSRGVEELRASAPPRGTCSWK